MITHQIAPHSVQLVLRRQELSQLLHHEVSLCFKSPSHKRKFSIGHFDLGRDSDILGIGPPLLVKRAEFCQSNSSTDWLDDIMGCRWDIDQSCTKYITKLTLHITPKHMIRGECFSAIFRGEDPLTSPKYRQFLRRDISDND